MKILHIDTCVRENSRTRILANYLLEHLDGSIEVFKPEKNNILPLNSETLDLRDKLIYKSDFNHPMFDCAKQFVKADIIVISAPLWDLSFPAYLKAYFENINILNLVFKYSEAGIPISLCKAKKLYYVTTSGGLNLSKKYGFNYVKALCETFYGINDVNYIKAEGLDIYGADVEKIMNNAKRKINNML